MARIFAERNEYMQRSREQLLSDLYKAGSIAAWLVKESDCNLMDGTTLRKDLERIVKLASMAEEEFLEVRAFLNYYKEDGQPGVVWEPTMKRVGRRWYPRAGA